MAGQVQALRRRIRTVKSTKKIAKAQELVATSRIAKAQERVHASKPYAEAITQVLEAVGHAPLADLLRAEAAAVIWSAPGSREWPSAGNRPSTRR